MIVEAAPAKLNLALHVRARRSDGYHAIETLFAFVADGDELRLGKGERDTFRITGPFAGALDSSGDNLVTRARDAFARNIAPLPPLAIELVKHLPVASGIGGGSADAAATLRACARVVGISVDDPRLLDVAAGLGSDVPACVRGVTALGSGRGEALVAVDGLACTPVLLVNPRVAVPTGPVFAAWDGIDHGPMPAGDAWTITREGRNDLATPAITLAPVIGDVLAALSGLAGSTLVRMSGSGATCFALFEDAASRAVGAREIGRAHPDWWCLKTVLV